jgi:hypothetical protein
MGAAHAVPAAADGHGGRRAGPAHRRPQRLPARPVDLPGVIGRAVLATLLPARHPRYSARKVKCATSPYLNRDDGRPAHPTTITAIAVCTPPVDLKPGRTHRDRRSTPAYLSRPPAGS